MEALGTFIGILVITALFAGWYYMTYRVSSWIFKRGVQKEIEKAKHIPEDEMLNLKKEEIARRLLDEQKQKELEEKVRQELIEKGKLPPENKA